MSPLTRGATTTAPSGPLGVLDIPGPRWFGPGDAVWRVHGGPAAPIGITAGLLLLAAHPAFVAMFAVAGADDDPWELDEYLTDMVTIGTFGTVDDAVLTIERTRRHRSRHAGTTELGAFYYGADPELAAWAHCTATWAMLAAHQRYSDAPLDATESDEYVRQYSRFAAIQGVPNAPRTVRELERSMRAGARSVHATSAGRRLLASLRSGAHACRADAGAVDHGRCTTVVDAALSVLPADVARALGHTPCRRELPAVIGRLSAAHGSLPAPAITTPAPIAAPTSLLVHAD